MAWDAEKVRLGRNWITTSMTNRGRGFNSRPPTFCLETQSRGYTMGEVLIVSSTMLLIGFAGYFLFAHEAQRVWKRYQFFDPQTRAHIDEWFVPVVRTFFVFSRCWDRASLWILVWVVLFPQIGLYPHRAILALVLWTGIFLVYSVIPLRELRSIVSQTRNVLTRSPEIEEIVRERMLNHSFFLRPILSRVLPKRVV